MKSKPLQQGRLTCTLWPLDLALGLLPFGLAAGIIAWAFWLPFGLHALTDFRQLYTGGYMIRTGHAYELYDYDAQMRFQHRLFALPPNAPILLINHPAFEELIFAPLTLLPYRTAFFLFMFINAAAVVVSALFLRPHTGTIRARWKWAPLLLIAGFFPLSRAMLQGQDSILVLLVLCCTLVLIDGSRPLSAGLVLGLAMFRFEVVLPIAVILLWRGLRFVLGFLISAGAAVLVSIFTVGLHGSAMYVQLLLSISLHLHDATSIARTAINPFEMMNLRGLLAAVLWTRIPHRFFEALLLAASLLVIYCASKMRPSLATAIVAASLVSYHFLGHDASIWLIPIFAALSSASVVQGVLGTCLLFTIPYAFFPPGDGRYAYTQAIPLLALFIAMAVHERKQHSDAIVSDRKLMFAGEEKEYPTL
jgi:Glycosyltransferase family 87